MRRGAAYPAAGLGAVLGAVLGLASLVAPAAAEAPDRSLRPDPRPGGAPVLADDPAAPVRVVVTATALAPGSSLRPAPRGGGGAVQSATSPVAQPRTPAPAAALPEGVAALVFTGGTGTRLAVAQSLRPGLRPSGLVQATRATAARNIPARVAQSGRSGSLCGVAGLLGEELDPIPGRIRGCGVDEPVRLREVDGIALSTPATVNCTTARALQTWVQRSVVPTVGRTGGGVRSLRVVASYACRTRNNQPGARISEHGRGNAIDIAGIGLADGSELTVLGGWRDRRAGPILQQLHRGACGPFGTVLGPNSDRFHQDHFHFDTASYRSGPYCR
ncbi:MAG: extensin family protein [Roseicyclus sp.]|nr:extensin family protein [Roseicyclus sp.]